MLVLTLFVAMAAPASSATCSIAVLDLVPRGLAPADAQSMPGLLADIIANEVASDSGCQVISQSDIKSMVDVEAGKQQCGENDSSCLAAIGESLGVARTVTGSIGKLGNDFVISLRLVDNAHARVLTRAEQVVSGSPEQLREAAKSGVRTLFRKDSDVDGGGIPAFATHPMFLGGVGLSVIGLGIGGAGAFFVNDAETRLGNATGAGSDKANAFAQDRLAAGAVAGGVVVLAGSAALIYFGINP
jgi:hypothetical protein